MINWKNFIGHWKTVAKHRKWVKRYCFKMGLYWQGLTHDISKYHPVEFFESVKYYQGTRSPIDACKEANGYSMAWFHHRGNNKHHYEYWVDNFDKGMTFNIMPYKYFVEMLCDYLGAGRAYMGRDFSYVKEREWWRGKRETIAMHPMQIAMLDDIFNNLANEESLGYDPMERTSLEIQGFVREIYEYYKKEA